MTQTQTASEQITEEVLSWPGTDAGHGSRGEFAFTIGRRELGHLHGDRVLHSGFPKAVWHELFDAGRIDYHPVFPGRPGYAARSIKTPEDVLDVIELLRLNYDRAIARHGLPVRVTALGDAPTPPQPRAGHRADAARKAPACT